MDNVQRKRSREKLESDEEDIEIVISLLSFLIGIVGAWYHENYFIKDLSMSDNDERAYRRALWMRCLRKDPTCLKELRVNARTFGRLCDVLCNEGGLVATKNVMLEEIVALFLHILGHDKKNSTITATFVHSSETNAMRALDGTFVELTVPAEEDPLLDEVDRELESNMRIEDDDSYNEEQITIVRNTNEWTTFRDDLARQMFEDYQARHAQVI
ncbi:UNVERIFIED_CONTAM: hypothetical protein Sradi_1499300 [Sesamum radiatum]|uniref:DUF8040 domain-containing protein n=1 Tax=Sesamum radiatum TaxID=300843 RepID=A0AAW2UBM2_SESRA